MQTELTGSTDMDRLTEPFDPRVTKTRTLPGPSKQQYRYVPSNVVIQRILDATNGANGWELVSIQLVPLEVIHAWSAEKREMVDKKRPAYWLVHGRLTLPGMGSKDAVGTSIDVDNQSAKSAETDAYKRAAEKFGVPLDFEAAPVRRVRTNAQNTTNYSAARANSQNAQGTTDARAPYNATGPVKASETPQAGTDDNLGPIVPTAAITDEQRKRLAAYCKERGARSSALTMEMFGTEPANISQAQYYQAMQRAQTMAVVQSANT